MNEGEENENAISPRWRLLYAGIVLYTLALILALYGLTFFLDFQGR